MSVRRPARRRPGIEQLAYPLVIGLEDLGAADRGVGVAQSGIARNVDRFAAAGDGRCHLGVAIAVDHQPRIILRHQRRIERGGHLARHAKCADVPGNVTLQFAGRQPQIIQPARDAPAGMIHDDDEIRASLPSDLQEGRRLVGGQQLLVRLFTLHERVLFPC